MRWLELCKFWSGQAVRRDRRRGGDDYFLCIAVCMCHIASSRSTQISARFVYLFPTYPAPYSFACRDPTTRNHSFFLSRDTRVCSLSSFYLRVLYPSISLHIPSLPLSLSLSLSLCSLLYLLPVSSLETSHLLCLSVLSFRSLFPNTAVSATLSIPTKRLLGNLHCKCICMGMF
jgi:hypothetical protein